MKLLALFLAALTLAFMQGCSSGSTTSLCATELSYVIKPNTSGLDAISSAASYMASLYIGEDDHLISAKLDTGSSQLIVNEENFVFGSDTHLGKESYVFDNGSTAAMALNAIDRLQVGCSRTIDARFSITGKSALSTNILGLAFGDAKRLPHEANNEPFFDQLVKTNGFKDVISLSLCGPRGNSHVLLGGVDEKMKNRLGNLIPISEKSSYVLPALSLRLADSKEIIGTFPAYNPKTKNGRKTILDSGTAFNMLPVEMAEAMVLEIIARAKDLSIHHQFPSEFFRTERAASTTVMRFKNLAQIRRFPSFEITFKGIDGKIKALELSPLHYFKEMSDIDPLLRTFALRETSDTVILGQPFMENHYIVLDRAHSAIAFGDIDYACAP